MVHRLSPETMTSCYGNLKCVPFNGKEKDYESGFHYYGTRYYWGELLTGWLSVDPMANKYPQISSYNYCIWNPIRIIDPDGRDGWDKIAGICIGFVTNVVPGTSRLRDIYSPTNMADYNSSLRAADNTTMVVGGLMATVGAMGAIAGSSLVSGISIIQKRRYLKEHHVVLTNDFNLTKKCKRQLKMV